MSDFIKSIAFKDNLFVGGLPEFLLPTALAFDRDGGDAYCRGIVEGICRL